MTRPGSSAHAVRALALGGAVLICAAAGPALARSASAGAGEVRQGSVAPCINSLEVSACEQWITYGPGPARSRVYSTFKLDTLNPGIRRGLILVHGANLMAAYYFRTGAAAAVLAGALHDTV